MNDCRKIWLEYLPNEIVRSILQDWLYIKDILHLDTAMTNNCNRVNWLANLKNVISPVYRKKRKLQSRGVVLPLQNDYVAVCSQALCVINPLDGKIIHLSTYVSQNVCCLTELPDNRIILADERGYILEWDLIARSCRPIVTDNFFPVTFLQILLDGTLLTYSAEEYSLRVWDLETKEVKSESSLQFISFLIRDEVELIACDGAEYVVEIRSMQALDDISLTLAGHTSFVYTVIALRDGRLASGSGDKSVKIWDYDSGACLKTLRGNIGYVTCLAQVSESRIAAGGTSICIWNINTGQCERRFGDSGPRTIFLLKDHSLVTCSENFNIEVWTPV